MTLKMVGVVVSLAMPTKGMKTCRTCNTSQSLDAFGTRTMKGRIYKRSQCRKCESKKRELRQSPEQRALRYQRHNEMKREQRAAGERTWYFVLGDSRQSDAKCGRENNLDTAFVREALAKGCSYCGETELRMTLDRVDNNLGHLKTNVVPACIRCNYARRSMPYVAWLLLVPGIRQAREQGLFGTWTGRAR